MDVMTGGLAELGLGQECPKEPDQVPSLPWACSLTCKLGSGLYHLTSGIPRVFASGQWGFEESLSRPVLAGWLRARSSSILASP